MSASIFRVRRTLGRAPVVAVAAAFSTLVLPTHAVAAELTGTVRDAVAGGPAVGASVRIEEADRQATANDRGRFEFSDVEPGRYTLIIEYSSYEEVRREVEIEGERGNFVVFTPPARKLGELTVEASRMGQYITKRSDPSVLDTVTSKENRRSPDDDVSETLKRLPGVNVASGQGGSFQEETVNIRGLGGSFNNVTINGQPVASTGASRAVPLDVIPSDIAREIEVRKTVTPDMDANSIGGTVNIKTPSAFDREGPFAFASGSIGNFSDDATTFERTGDDEIPRKVSIVAGNKFGADDQLGVTVNLNHQYDEFNTEIAEPDHHRDARNGVFLPTDTRLTQDDSTRERFSIGGRLDYRPNESSEYYLDAFHTETERTEAETMTQWKFLNDSDDADQAINNPLPGKPGDFRTPVGVSDVDKEADFSDQDSETTFLTLGTVQRFGQWTVEADAHYSEAERHFDTDEWSIEIDGLTSVVQLGDIDWAVPVDERFGNNAKTDLEKFNDSSEYRFDEIDREGVDQSEETYTLGTDIRRDLELFGSLPGYVKTGFNFRNRQFERDEIEKQFEPKTDITLDEFNLGGRPDDVQGLPIAPGIDPVGAASFDRNNRDVFEFIPGESTEGSLEGDSEVEEDVLAGYFMVDADINQWNIVTGVRVERTETDSSVLELRETEQELTFNESNIDEITNTETQSNSYTDFFPSITTQYRFSDRLTLRAAATRTIARPELQDLAGAEVVDLAKDRLEPGAGPNGRDLFPEADVSRGNPDLDPRESNNLDLGAEYYFDNGGIAAAALFYKSIDDPIFQSEVVQQDQIVQGNFVERIEIRSRENASEGSVYGLELQYNSQLTMLPAPWDGFGINANVSFTDSEIDIPDRDDDPSLGGQADTLLNIVPYYQQGPVAVRFSYNYTDEFVTSFGSEKPQDEFRDSRFQVGAHASYEFSNNFVGFAEVQNLTEEPFEEVHTGSGRLTRHETVPRSLWVGLRARF